MRRRPVLHGVAILAIASAVTASAANIPPVPLPELVDSVFAATSAPDRPGCAVGIMRPGEPDLLKGFGATAPATGSPIGADTSFNVGSVSKQFTGYAITLLERDGRLSLHDPIGRYLPELPAWAGAVTIDQLLHHSGGVPNLELLIRLRGLVGNGTVPASVRLKLLAGLDRWNQPPGVAYDYSNTGYVLLAEIVARVSGMPFARFAEQRIFRPAGMHRTIVLDAVRGGTDAAPPFDADGSGGFSPSASMFPGEGPAGVQTTVRDLLAWARFIDHGAGASLLPQMRVPGRLNDGRRLAYGRGLRLGTDHGLAVVGHQGAWASYRADFRFYPDRHVAIAITCNRSDAVPWEDGDRIAAAIFAHRPPGVPDDTRALRIIGAERRTPSPGLYREDVTGAYLRLVETGGRLSVANGSDRFELTHERAGVFRTRIVAAFPFVLRMAFAPGRGGAPDRLVTRSFGEPGSYSRVRAWQPAGTSGYLGRYASRALGLTAEVDEDAAGLILRIGGRTLPLAPLGEDEFGVPDGSVVLAFARGMPRPDRFNIRFPTLRRQVFTRID